MSRVIEVEVCVVGGGSGGVGAAVRSAGSGCRTVLVERSGMLGGTTTVCGVSCWEPVRGASCGLPRELYERMRKIPGACGIYHAARHFCWPDPARNDFPGGQMRIDSALGYDDTLKRGYDYFGPWSLDLWNGVIFEPEIMHRCMMESLEEAGCRVITGAACVQVVHDQGRIQSIVLSDGAEIRAGYWIDNCGVLASAVGAEILMGCDPAAHFGEADAPEQPGMSRLNGVTMMFRIRRKAVPGIDDFDGAPLKGCMVAVEYPNGDYSCNMLPTMKGVEFLTMDRASALAECRRRVLAFWKYVQLNYAWARDYEIAYICPEAGVRESFRVLCEYMLSEDDVVTGLERQTHPDMVAVADHHIDFHGAGNVDKKVVPYGIPYRCLLPRKSENLLVAGRIAGFTCLAASSCRLARTMMRLGEAAGYAAALAVKHNLPLRRIPPSELQDLMDFTAESV